ncbi:hypothetical protein N7454_004884 [Penicillium verhagenii]|nr:hypothetical protein N7454_004884 [Penicillium verhagenii]
MRPALNRLLKRPSALSIIDSLVTTSIGIEQLEFRYARLQCQSRCQSKCASQPKLADDKDTGVSHQEKANNPWLNKSKTKPLSFSIYDIEPNHPSPEPSSRANNSAPSGSPECITKSLQLNPERLEFESDIGHSKDLGTRLVDLPEHRNNFELWEELLRFRQRQYGDHGTEVIWDGITNRAGGVKLPLTGKHADFFWQSFVDLGLKQETFLKEVLDYAVILGGSDGCCWSGLYERVVGGLLERDMKKQAIDWHRKLQDSQLASPSDLLRIIPYAIPLPSLTAVNDVLLFATPRPTLRSTTPLMRIKTLKALCRGIDHHIYGPVILSLLEQGYGEDALAMHGWLTARRDHPESMQELQHLLEYTRKYGLRQEYDNLRDYAQLQFPSTFPEQDMSQGRPASEKDTKSGSSGKREYKDDIAARLFATRALNFDMVIGGLRMLGIAKIGPRTLREMAVRAHDSQEILTNLKLLRQAGITTTDSVFAKLVPKLAAQTREFLLSDLLQSDQHPDALEDAKLQESLLISYYMARDSRQYNMSLAILAEHFPDSPGLLDIHFRKHLAAGELSAASKVVDELTLLGKTLSEDSVDFMAEKVLPSRRMHHQPQVTQGLPAHDAAIFVFKVLQRVVPTGCYVSPAFWQELLKRFGMGNHWDELRECSMWLVDQYTHRPEEKGKHRGILSSQQMPTIRSDNRVLGLIFDEEMQQAIISWGFKLRVTHATINETYCLHPATGAKLIPWTRGLILLRELEEAGLALRLSSIRRATQIRLNLLFGVYCHSAVRFNRMLRRVNPYSQDEVYKDINLA